jgi:hypothetical protein
MRKLVIVTIFTVVVLAVAGVFALYYVNSQEKEQPSNYQGGSSGSSSNYVPQQFQYGIADEEDYSNFESIIKQNQMIKDLPDDGTLVLSFYNFYSGDREWEKNYVLTKGNAGQGEASEYDIKMVMHSKYLTVLNPNNLCSVIKTAKSNGDFGTETAISKTKLLWKYKSMTEYKDCLGL